MFELTQEARDAALPLGLLVGALAIAWWIGRGRRVGDHPTCRRCDFDLFGSADADRCPECGADLTRPRAQVIGIRHVRHGWKQAMLGVAGLCGLWAVGQMYVTFANVQVVELKPTSMLVNDLASPQESVHEEALVELRRRLREGELDFEQQLDILKAVPEVLESEARPQITAVERVTQQIYAELPEDHSFSLLSYWQTLARIGCDSSDPRQSSAVRYLLDWYDRGSLLGGKDEVPITLFVAMVDPLLAIQADRSTPDWSINYGDAIMVAHLHNRLSEAQLQQYLANMVRVELEARPDLRVGLPLPIRYTVNRRGHTEPAARPGNPAWQIGIGRVSYRLNGGENLVDKRTPLFLNEMAAGAGNVTGTGLGRLLLDDARLPPPGVHQALFEIPLVLHVPGHEPVYEWTASTRGQMKLRAADEPAVDLLRGPEMEVALYRAIRPDLRYGPEVDGRQRRPGGLQGSAPVQIAPDPEGVEATVAWDELPCALSMQWFLRDPETGRTWGPFSPFTAEPGEAAGPGRAWMRAKYEEIDGFTGDEIDIILRPYPEGAATRDFDITEIWGKEILIERQPIHRPEPRPQ